MPMLGALKKALRQREDLRESEQQKTAVVDARDEDCDEVIEGFELGLYAAVKKNRGHAKYRRYFKDGLREVTQAEPRKAEPEQVGKMLAAMKEDAGDVEIGPVVTAFEAK
ncbi:MAG: hypothetical protein ABI193_06910, partial [Minicystis sp.]